MRSKKLAPRTIGQRIGQVKRDMKKEAMSKFISTILKIPLSTLKLMSRKMLSGYYSKALLKAKNTLKNEYGRQ